MRKSVSDRTQKIDFFESFSVLEEASNQTLLVAWNQGSQEAAQVLVQRYMLRLLALARSRISRKLARRIEAEDVVMSAWRSFFVGAGTGRFAFTGHDDLWPLLVTITVRKIARQAARQTAGRRDIRLDLTLDINSEWQTTISQDPTPEQAAILADEIESLMQRLNIVDRDILTRRLQGEDQTSIAQSLNCSERTVRRSLNKIRNLLAKRDENTEVPLHKVECLPLKAKTEIPPGLLQRELVATHHYDEFTLQKLIGSGGFGKVYRSISKADGSPIAVKFLRKQFWTDHRARNQLLQETRIVSSLSHPNIIRHHGWGNTSQGAVFVVMDWVDGPNVQEWFQLESRPLSDIIGCAVDVSEAIHAAHEAGVIHGDLTPGNVLRRRNGVFVLTDFGFARSIGEMAFNGSGGTPGFLAPEQVTDLFGPIGTHTDVYGFGGLMYAILTGHPPVSGDDLSEILANVLSSKSLRDVHSIMSEMPPSLAGLLEQCLQKEPQDRPPSMAEVRKELQEITKQI